MFQAKLVCFLISIVVAVSETQNNVDTVGVKRSAICLIQRVAHYNHIDATFSKLNFEHRNGTTHVDAKLQLGKEEYISNSTSFTKAKEKVSQQAYAKTKYTKPEIRNRTCLINSTPPVKSDISLLEEYANAINSSVSYEEKPQNIAWQYEISLNGHSAAATSNKKKKEAKKLAATNLIEKIGRTKIIDTLTAKFNKSEYHSMEPTKRLRKIVQVSDPTSDGVYTIFKEVSERKAGQNVKLYIVQVEAKDFMTTGEGYTFEEARTNAAANLLKYFNFVVDYPPKKQN